MAPLIAVFTGMRREEVCALKGRDFDEHDGIWIVRVQPTEGRRLKSIASRRDIPIHSELIKIGLREYVAYRGRGFLFPELVPSKVDGARGNPLGRWFHHYWRRIGVDRLSITHILG
jgi:integrase